MPTMEADLFCLFSSCLVLLATLIPRCGGLKCFESLLGLELVHDILQGGGGGKRRRLGNDNIGLLLSLPLICWRAPQLSWSQKAEICIGLVDTGHLSRWAQRR